MLEDALRSQLGVTAELLGFETLDVLAASMLPTEPETETVHSHVHKLPMLDHDETAPQQAAPMSITKEFAVECLASAPLLLDLGSWLHWSDLFEQQLGLLGPFVRQIAVEHNLEFLDCGACIVRLESAANAETVHAAACCGECSHSSHISHCTSTHTVIPSHCIFQCHY